MTALKKRTKIGLGVLALGVGAFALYVSQLDALPQGAHFLFPDIEAPKAQDRILLLSPHEDDETLGAGGYLMAAAEVGAAVRIVYATDGNRHGLKEKRYGEAREVISLLGLKDSDIEFFGYPDGHLREQEDFPARLEKEIDAFRPTLVITTLPVDLHPDHAHCGRTVHALHARRPDLRTMYFLIHYHRYPRPIGYKPHRYLLPPLPLLGGDYAWRNYELTPETSKLKKKIIQEYRTQITIKNPIGRQLLFSFDRRNEIFAHLDPDIRLSPEP